MDYTAGNLNVVLNGIDSNASTTIDKVAKSLKTLSTSLQAITQADVKSFKSFTNTINSFSKNLDTSTFYSKITMLDSAFGKFTTLSTSLSTLATIDRKSISSFGTTLSNLTKKITAIDVVSLENTSNAIATIIPKIANSFGSLTAEQVEKLKQISNTFKGFSYISKLENIDKVFDKIDFDKVTNGFNKLTTAITPFVEKIITAESSLQSLNSILTKVSGKKLSSLTNFANNTNVSNIGLFSKFGKRLFSLAMAKRLGQALANIVQAGTDFTETLNLWQVAMRGNLDLADEFIKKMNKAYGISQNTLMNAQATFKNMVGSLGNISDNVAYQLSESILQMALDFSSLYNVTFENAITKFQAVLSGQVRPIRTAGYDITENTLYQFYQQIGGTKTQRQLNRTEKQMLALYAVLRQMQASGAVGDLAKTLDNFANQSRMLSENFKELKTYVGLFFQELLQSWGVLKYINAGVIFLTEIVKALVNYKTPNFIEGMFESTEAENEALDELQGKLLDFDKFRALDTSASTSSLAIDQTILDSLKEYRSILDNVNNEARELATKWLKDINILIEDENGNLVINKQRLNDIKNTLIGIVSAIGGILALNFGVIIVKSIIKITQSIGLLNGGLLLLDSVIVGTFIFSLVKLIQAFKDGDTTAQILYTSIMALSIIAFVTLNKQIFITIGTKIGSFFSNIASILTKKTIPALMSTTTSFTLLHAAIGITSFTLLYLITDKLLSNLDGTARKVTSITLAVVGLATALFTLKAILTDGLSLANVALLTAGAGMFAAGLKNTIQSFSIPSYAVGASNIDSGTVFRAGEGGKVETVYTASNGKTNVANVKQMKMAFYQALVEYGETHKNDDNQPIIITLDGEIVYKNTTAHAKRRGEHWSK